MLYLKNRKSYRHVLGTKISGMPNFIFNLNTFMGLKINACRVIEEKQCFWADILDFEGLASIFALGIQQIWIQHPLIPLEMLYTKNKHEMPSAFYTSTFSEILSCLIQTNVIFVLLGIKTT